MTSNGVRRKNLPDPVFNIFLVVRERFFNTSEGFMILMKNRWRIVCCMNLLNDKVFGKKELKHFCLIYNYIKFHTLLSTYKGRGTDIACEVNRRA